MNRKDLFGKDDTPSDHFKKRWKEKYVQPNPLWSASKGKKIGVKCFEKMVITEGG